MSLASPNYGAGAPTVPVSTPYAFANAQAFAGTVLPQAAPIYSQPQAQNYPIFMPQSSYTPIAPFPPSTSYQAPATPNYAAPAYASAQAYASTGYPPVASSYPAPMSYPSINIYPPVSYPPVNAQASASSSSSSDNQLLMMLMMLLMNMNNRPSGNGQYPPHPHGNQGRPVNNNGQQADILERNDRRPPVQTKDWGAVKGGATPTLGADGNYHIPPKHKSGREAIVSPNGQVIQTARDPLTFDLDGDGFNTTNEKVETSIDGEKLVVNNIDKDDAVMTLNGEIVGEKADLSRFGITEKPKDAQDVLRLLAEKAEKEGLIKDATKLTTDDLETLHNKFGLSVRVGSLNAEDKSFAEAGIQGVDVSKAATQTQNNFDGKGNSLATNGTSFTRKDGTKGNVGDIWFKQ